MLSPQASLENDLAYAKQSALFAAGLAWIGWGLAALFGCWWWQGGCLT